MSARRILVVAAIAALGLGVFAGPAAALEGNSFSSSGGGGGGGGGGEVLPNHETTAPPSVNQDVLGETITAPSSPTLALTESEPATAPSGTLPFTGADIVELSLLGFGAIAAGTILARRSRTRTRLVTA